MLIVTVKYATLVGIFSFLLKHVFFTMISLGVGVKHLNHRPGPCRVVPNIECGSEQIVATLDGLAFISSGIKDAFSSCKSDIKGKMYTFDFNRPGEGVTELGIVSNENNKNIVPLDPATLSPHGFDILEIGTGAEMIVRIYLVAHIGLRESVEVLEWSRQFPKMLTHLQTIRDPNFYFLNDLAVLEDGSFYATNWISATARNNHHLLKVEAMLKLKTGNIIFYDASKKSSRIVADNLSIPNGITVSKGNHTEGHLLFVAVINAGSVNAYSLDANKNTNEKLDLFSSIHVGWGVDNLQYDSKSGYLYGAYAKPSTALLQDPLPYEGPDMVSSSVVQIKPNTSAQMKDGMMFGWDAHKGVTVQELFHDDGQMISMASSAWHHNQNMLIGTVGHKMAYCEIHSTDDV